MAETSKVPTTSTQTLATQPRDEEAQAPVQLTPALRQAVVPVSLTAPGFASFSAADAYSPTAFGVTSRFAPVSENRFDAAFRSFQRTPTLAANDIPGARTAQPVLAGLPTAATPAIAGTLAATTQTTTNTAATTTPAVSPTVTPARDPMAVVNPNAPHTMDAAGFTALMQGGRIRVDTLVSDPEVRRFAADTAMAAVERQQTGAWGRLSTSVRNTLEKSFDAATRTRLRREGVGALTPEQRETLRGALADERMNQLRNIGGRSGTVSEDNADALFGWLDRFDSNGRAGSVAMTTAAAATPAQPVTEPRLTAAGRVMQRLLENNATPTSFSETDFVQGFRNGTIDGEKLRNNEQARAVLAEAGILGDLDRAAANGRTTDGHSAPQVQLTVPQLRALYRVVDRLDSNGSADSFIARTGGRTGGNNLPFVTGSETNETETASGRLVGALNGVFNSRHRYTEGEAAPSRFDVPPPSATDTSDPVNEAPTRLSDRTSFDRATFIDNTRDARIDLSRITNPDDLRALAAAGLSIEQLRQIAAPNGTIGGPNGEMRRLYATLEGLDRRRGSGVQLYDQNGLVQTKAGIAVSVLERYIQRHDVYTQERFRNYLEGTRFDLAQLDRPLPRERVQIPLVPGVTLPNPLDRPPTLRQALASITNERGERFDIAGFEAYLRANPNNLRGQTAAMELYRRLETFGAYGDARPHTFSRGVATNGNTADTGAGRVLRLMEDQSFFAIAEQRRRAYATADNALQAPAGMRTVSLPFTHYIMRSDDDCMLRVGDTVRNGPGGRPISYSGVGHWMAESDDRQGHISGGRGNLESGRRFVDYALDNGWRIGVGVARLNGGNRNRDGITDHYVTIVGRGRDEQGRVYYSYAENGSSARVVGRFYVDPRTSLMYAPVNAPYTVGGGGYQVTHVRAYGDRDFGDEFRAATGQDPRTLGAPLGSTRRVAPRPAKRRNRRS